MWCTTGAFCCLATRSALTLMWKLGPIPFHRMSTSVPVCDFSSLSLSLMQPAADDTFWHFELGGSFLPSENIRFEASQWQSTVAQVVGVFLTSFCQKCEQRTFFCWVFFGSFQGSNTSLVHFAVQLLVREQQVSRNILKRWTVGIVHAKVSPVPLLD